MLFKLPAQSHGSVPFDSSSSSDLALRQMRTHSLFLSTGLLLSLTACGSNSSLPPEVNLKPSFLGAVSASNYDGSSDDLLTAGMGKTGLAGTAPVISNSLLPSASELRRSAIYNNYRALVDVSAGGGYGSLFGPNIDNQGKDTLGEGKIAGTEYIAYADEGTGQQNITMMVQVPASFNAEHPCIVTGTSSGSRGVYGAIGTSGEWGLKNGCAVAYHDKGTGLGIHDIENNTVSIQNGLRSDVLTAGKLSNFTAKISETERAAFNLATPFRFAVKHAHSQQNPEKDWGKWTLQSIEFAYYVLNEKYGKALDNGTHEIRLKTGNTIVIASSASNGAGAAIAAAEQDSTGLISGIAVSEPQIQLAPDTRLSVKRGTVSLTGSGKTIFDYFTLANLMQPCAGLVSPASNVFTTLNSAIAENRCNALKVNGLISGTTTAELAASAMAVLNAAGWQAESNDLQASHYSFATLPVALSYANAYGRFSVLDHVCGFSYAATNASGVPAAANPALIAGIFGTGNGVPPTAGINIINNNSTGGALLDSISISNNGKQDYNIAGALCLRELATGSSANAKRVQQGISEVIRSANLRGKPAIIVHGRSDTLVPVALTSRPYFGMNQIIEGSSSKLRYIEVTNAQHFDSFLGFPGYNARLLPLHRYYIQAMDMMFAHLKSAQALPASQLVRTTPRGITGSQVNPVSASNVPPILLIPAASEQITFSNNTVTIPD